MKPEVKAHIEFIKSCLRKGEKRETILGKFGKKWETVSRTTFDRRLSSAVLEMGEELKAIEQRTEQSINKEVEARTGSILTAIERQEYLTQIIKGEIKIPNTKFFFDSRLSAVIHQEVEEYPDHAARIRAIAELNKMDGAYAPTKVAQTDKEGKDVTPTQVFVVSNETKAALDKIG
jgi:hypothetical protein